MENKELIEQLMQALECVKCFYSVPYDETYAALINKGWKPSKEFALDFIREKTEQALSAGNEELNKKGQGD